MLYNCYPFPSRPLLQDIVTLLKSYRIQYITFCFTSLELQNERTGMGGEQK